MCYPMNLHYSKVSFSSLPKIIRISRIIESCGENMYEKYNLPHWKNSLCKTILIVLYTMLIKGMTLWAVTCGQNIIATYLTKKDKGYLNFAKFAVDPSFEGKGLGTKCISEMTALAKANALKGLSCEVMSTSEHALNFYLHRGFRQVGSTKTLKYTEFKLIKKLEE